MSTNLPSIVDFQSGKLAIHSNPFADAFNEAIGDDVESVAALTSIKIDHRAGMFLVNGEPTDFVEGYPINFLRRRAWWAKAYKPGDSSPPDCASDNAMFPSSGEDRQNATCDGCPQAQFGSARDDKGQACSVTTSLFLLNPAFGDPPIGILEYPPSSIKEINGIPASSRGAGKPGYLARAAKFAGAGPKSYALTFSRFGLESAGDLHCVLTAEPLGVAEGEAETMAIVAAIKSFQQHMQQAAKAAAEAEAAGERDTE